MAVPYYIAKIDPTTDKVLETFLNIRHAERLNGFDHSNISKAINGKGNLVGGFKWAKVPRSADLPKPTIPDPTIKGGS